MKKIEDRQALTSIITDLKNTVHRQEAALRQRFSSTPAILGAVWTLFPWSQPAPKANPVSQGLVSSAADKPINNPTQPHFKMAFKDYFTKQAFKNGLTILKAAFSGFMNDLALKYSASLAYYTIFSLGPLLLLIISLAGIFLGKDAIQGKVFSEINGFVGNDAAKQIQDMIKHLEMSGKSTISVIIGVVTLIIGATTVFGEIQESINIIWQVKAKPKKAWLKLVKDRLLSGSLIVSLGFLLLVSLVLNGALLAISDKLKSFLPDVTVVIFNVINVVVSFIVITVLFGVIFKVLPDVKISWRDVRSGAIFTAILFMLGRLVIGIYVSMSANSSTYGAAGALIAILLWVYYTAAILYFGAEFTKAYADFTGKRIEPAEYAVHVEQTEEEKDVAVLPEKKDKASGKPLQ